MKTRRHTGTALATTLVLLVGTAAATAAHAAQTGPATTAPARLATTRSATAAGVRLWTIRYTAHNGADRLATVVLPAWYGPHDNPPLPVVVSPHGRGATGRSNAGFWGNLPAAGRFAVISPDGMGRRLRWFSYGYRGQIDDLARMPQLAMHALPWLRLDLHRVYALGSSMGGQETLLLVARHPEVLAGAAALDSVTDLVRRYGQLRSVPCDASCRARWGGKPYGLLLQDTMRRELGGTPDEKPQAYAERSATSQAAKIAFSRVPLQIWWSRNDQIVKDQAHQSAALYGLIRRLNPCAPVSALEGTWEHSHEMRADALLPVALRAFGLLPASTTRLPASAHLRTAPTCSAEAVGR